MRQQGGETEHHVEAEDSREVINTAVDKIVEEIER